MRYAAKALALTAGVAVTGGTAFGAAVDGLTVNAPVNGNIEITGGMTTIDFDLPAGQAGAGTITDGQPISRAALIGLDNAGAAIAGVFLDVGSGLVANPNYSDAGGNTGLQIDLSVVAGVNSFLNTAGVDSFRLIATTTDVTLNLANVNGIQTVFNANEAIDQNFTVDTVNPQLSAVILSQDGTNLFWVFNELLNTGGAANDINQTVLASITAAGDFQLSSDGGATFADTPTLLTDPPTFAAGTNSILQFARAMASNTTAGTFVRAAPGSDLNDIVGNVSESNPIAITNQVAIAASSANWVEAVPIGGGLQTGALRVTFNNPMNPAALGVIAGANSSYFVRRVDVNGMEEQATLTLSNPTIDPTDPFSVLLDVSPSGNEGVGADGRSISNNTGVVPDFVTYSVVVSDLGAVDPTDVFGGAEGTFSGEANLAAGELIEPSLSFTAHGDTLPVDGSQDTVFFVFDEAMVDPGGTTGFTVVRQGGVTVQPFQLINPDGSLTDAMTVTDAMTPANNNININSVSIASIDANANGIIDARENNNAVAVAYQSLLFDWDNDGDAGIIADDDEAVPGTGNNSVVQGQYTVATGTIADGNGNVFMNGGTDVASLTAFDRSAPFLAVSQILDNDNMQNNFSNNQLFSEQDGGLGQNIFTRRVALFFGENLAPGLNSGNVNESQVRVNGNALANNSSFVFANTNSITLDNANGDTGFDVGASVSIAASSGIDDSSGNEALSNGTAGDGRAPYAALLSPVDGGAPILGAFLADTNDDGFADEIRIQMTQPIDAATLDTSDFSLSFGTVNSVALGDSNRVITLSLTDGVVDAEGTVTVTYNGATDTNPIASDAAEGGTGLAISGVNDSFTAQAIPESSLPAQTPAIMTIVGTGLDNGEPLPAGTKVYAMIALPVFSNITATHNNITFETSSESSLEAFIDWYYGIESYVYLGRDEENFQFYRNDKDLATEDNERTLEDVIDLDISARSIDRITFRGSGETRDDSVDNGSLEVCWDVWRSSNGTVDSFYSSGFDIGGDPILSRTVITGDDGRFEIHVAGPASTFNGRANLNAVGFPIIMICELPDGRRFPLSSLLTSVRTNDRGALFFSPNNLTQNDDNEGPDATVFNFDRANVGSVLIYPAWNLLPFNRHGGFANSSGDIPTLPAGLDEEDDIVEGTDLPFAGPMEQFVYWDENTVDGDWTASEDSDFSEIIIDTKCFDNFFFTLDDNGVSFGSGVGAFIGGYAAGFFNNEGTIGCFQFGPMRTGTTFFDDEYSNSSSNEGWGLFTSPATFDPATGVTADNPDFDYLIQFMNNNGSFDVNSIDLLTPNGTDGINNTETIEAGQPGFYHVNN